MEPNHKPDKPDGPPVHRHEALQRSVRLLLTRRFGTFWFANLLSNIGTWAQQVAQPWLMLSLGASSFLLGVDAFAMGAPVLLLTLIGGELATGALVTAIGVREALLMNGTCAVLAQLAIGRAWRAASLPDSADA